MQSKPPRQNTFLYSYYNPPQPPIKSIKALLTCPCASIVLLVSLSLLNDTGLAVQWWPGAGESGCIMRRRGDWGSAPPAAAHWPPAQRQRRRPTSDNSRSTQYSSRGSSPLRDTRSDGNMRLWRKKGC